MTFGEFREYLAEFAWFWPGVVISVVLSLVLGSPFARVVGARRAVGALLAFSVGLIVSATLTPSVEALRWGAVGRGSCDLDRLGPASFAEMIAFGDPTFNILLFIPLGLACGLIPWSSRKVAVLLGAFALPIAIETVQLLATSLDRACQTSDVSDNLTGLVIGLAVGELVRGIVGFARGGHDRTKGAPEVGDPTPGPIDAAGPPQP